MAGEFNLADHFAFFREGTIGHDQMFQSPFGMQRLLYADWTASGRAYGPIEDCLRNEVMPFLGNTHTGSTASGSLMSEAYNEAKVIIKSHVNAGEDDVLLFCDSGMTAAVNKLQRILGLRVPERLKGFLMKGNQIEIDEQLRPVVFITHMEHHSNQVSWLETISDVEIIQADENGNVDMEYFKSLLERFRHRKNKIAAVTACSNVTGIETHYHKIAKMIHSHGGLCFVDFAGSAPYVAMDMHPGDSGGHLDAIYFSPHKFLGGPGAAGVLIFNKSLYDNTIPDQPGGGTVVYSNPWKEHDYVIDIQLREEAGTPPILQGIKAAMCVQLKEAMGVEYMRLRKDELLQFAFDRFAMIKNIEVLAKHNTKRMGILSFIVKGAHYSLIVKLLNDRFGIQTRGGCACAGTYGHHLLQVDVAWSYLTRKAIHAGDLSQKPGWIRLSLHPTMTNCEIEYVMDAIASTAACYEEWATDYTHNTISNEFVHNTLETNELNRIKKWFTATRS